MWTNINSLVLDKAEQNKRYYLRHKERMKQTAREWYSENKQRALDRIKGRYWENKDNPEFRANKLEQQKKSRVNHLFDVRAGALDYYYRNKDRTLAEHRKGLLFLGKWISVGFNPRHGKLLPMRL